MESYLLRSNMFNFINWYSNNSSYYWSSTYKMYISLFIKKIKFGCWLCNCYNWIINNGNSLSIIFVYRENYRRYGYWVLNGNCNSLFKRNFSKITKNNIVPINVYWNNFRNVTLLFYNGYDDFSII